MLFWMSWSSSPHPLARQSHSVPCILEPLTSCIAGGWSMELWVREPTSPCSRCPGVCKGFCTNISNSFRGHACCSNTGCISSPPRGELLAAADVKRLKPRFLVCGRHWRQPTCTSDWREYEQHHVALALPSKFDLSTFVKHSPTIYNTQLPSVTATFSLLKTTPWARRPTHEGLLNGLPTIAAIRCRNPRFQHSPAGRVSWTY